MRHMHVLLVALGVVFAAGSLGVTLGARAEAGPAPTPDRLAAPPTVENPTQADEGAQLYWLNCQPCHGDQGQGLTDEWRAQYPPEDQNCWEAGCHGERPYANGFTLPRSAPAVIGPNTLARFNTAADLYAFVSRAMPFQAPGSLKTDEYWAVTAFLLRGQGLSDATWPLKDEAAARLIVLNTPAPPQAAPTPTLAQDVSGDADRFWFVTAGGLVLIGVAALAWVSFKRRHR